MVISQILACHFEAHDSSHPIGVMIESASGKSKYTRLRLKLNGMPHKDFPASCNHLLGEHHLGMALLRIRGLP